MKVRPPFRGVEQALRDLAEEALTKAKGKPKPVYACKKCGACCAGFFVGPAGILRVELYEKDLKRLPKSFRRNVAKYEDDRPMIKAVKRCGAWRCPAMRGTVGRNTSCAIYPRRPYNCRYFEPNDNMCRMARFEYGLPLVPRPTRVNLIEAKVLRLADEAPKEEEA